MEALAKHGDQESIDELASVPAIPKHATHLWTWWLDLAATRGGAGFGLAPLSRVEIHAWEVDEGNYLQPWERRAILRLDAAYRLSVQPDDPKEST